VIKKRLIWEPILVPENPGFQSKCRLLVFTAFRGPTCFRIYDGLQETMLSICGVLPDWRASQRCTVCGYTQTIQQVGCRGWCWPTSTITIIITIIMLIVITIIISISIIIIISSASSSSSSLSFEHLRFRTFCGHMQTCQQVGCREWWQKVPRHVFIS
jgi:hypothetical protein